jgi:hypothetical protein
MTVLNEEAISDALATPCEAECTIVFELLTLVDYINLHSPMLKFSKANKTGFLQKHKLMSLSS